MGFWDDLSSIGSFFNNISPIINTGFSIYKGLQGGGGSQPSYAPPPFDPSKFQIPMPDFSEMFAGLNEMFAAQQEAFAKQQQELETQQMKNLARQAVSTRKGLQSQGVYEGGAVTPDALANLMGVDDMDQFRKALAQYGKDYGWT